jgi:hypothetical protein
MKIKLQIKSRWTGSVLFEYEKENNTIKETLIAAVKSGADLSDAYLRGADLSDAYLSDAYLRDADLSGANLRGANLSDAYLSDAYLRGADLHGANLSGANLSDADLHGANLSGANLSDADLSDAYLRDADLSGANLRGANLRGAKEIPYLPLACPSLQQEQTEVDLEKEVQRWKNKHGIVGMDDLWLKFAHHFYELGLNARKDR